MLNQTTCLQRRLARSLFLLLVPFLGCHPADSSQATPEEAAEFVQRVEEHFTALGEKVERTGWVQSTYLTHDTEILAAEALRELVAATAQYGKEATRFDGVQLPAEVERKLKLIKVSLPLAAPDDPAKQAQLTETATAMESLYGRGKYCPEGRPCMTLGDLSRVLAESRKPDDLLDAWQGWRTVSPPMRDMYTTFASLGNEGARELGFNDLGALWRSSYDMEPDAFAAELDRLWEQVRPLYEALHCHVRARLAEKYGPAVASPEEPIPAHLLGNMWAQQWGNIFDLVAPPRAASSYDLTEVLQRKKVDEIEMVRYGERFFSSLGFEPLPDTFWERSQFTKPRDREVVCHASAWDINLVDDIRIKMCIEVNAEDFSTIHHELGHNYYQRAYSIQPVLFRGSANDGFHEGIGDTIALSITPEYLKEVGLINNVPGPDGDLELLMRMALDRVAFLPFGLLVDQWRWKVFSGEVTPANYNAAWWELREKYQGLKPPTPRSESHFDPGAKYHVPANTPYSRYFIAHILQFQFQRALCNLAGYEGPLHRCSIYNSKEAGSRLNQMLEMGLSKPWPDALEIVTGQRKMDATAILDYFQPLKQWLDEQNAGRSCGW